MALVRYIMGKFLGIVCHCFPPKSQYNLKNEVAGLSLFYSRLRPEDDHLMAETRSPVIVS